MPRASGWLQIRGALMNRKKKRKEKYLPGVGKPPSRARGTSCGMLRQGVSAGRLWKRALSLRTVEYDRVPGLPFRGDGAAAAMAEYSRLFSAGDAILGEGLVPSMRHMEAVDTIYPEGVGRGLRKEFKATGSTTLMIRACATACAHRLDALREDRHDLATTGAMVLDGPKGVGKSVILHQLVAHCRSSGWIVLFVPSAFAYFHRAPRIAALAKCRTEIAAAGDEHLADLYDCPESTMALLSGLHRAHELQLDALPTQCPETVGFARAVGAVISSVGDLVELGTSELNLAPHVLVCTVRELAAVEDKPVLFAIDDANALAREVRCPACAPGPYARSLVGARATGNVGARGGGEDGVVDEGHAPFPSPSVFPVSRRPLGTRPRWISSRHQTFSCSICSPARRLLDAAWPGGWCCAPSPSRCPSPPRRGPGEGASSVRLSHWMRDGGCTATSDRLQTCCAWTCPPTTRGRWRQWCPTIASWARGIASGVRGMSRPPLGTSTWSRLRAETCFAACAP